MTEIELRESLRQIVTELLNRVANPNMTATPQATSKEVPPEITRWAGAKITLPQGMSYGEGILWLQRMQEEEESAISFSHRIPCFPLDGLVAFHRALAEKYGWSQMVPTPGFFGPKPPTMIGIPTSPTEHMSVAIGRCKIPNISGHLQVMLDVADDDPALVIGGESQKKHEKEILELAELTRRHLAEGSIYKGKAIKVDFEWAREVPSQFHPEKHAPRFMDVGEAPELIFSDSVQSLLQIGLFGPIEHSQACRRHGVPLKRGVLLHGRYGTGKTLTALATAHKAVKAGFTFIYLSSVLDLKRGLDMAQRYAPAVLFAEDIDRVVTGPRSPELDEILNTLDGIDTKHGEVITVFTTNHIEQVNKAALRAGRLDALIEVTPPDARAAEKLVRLYGRDLLAEGIELQQVADALHGRIPSTIREVVERSKIAAIVRTGGEDIKGKITAEDLLRAAGAMAAHEALLIEPHRERRSRLYLIEEPKNGCPQHMELTPES